MKTQDRRRRGLKKRGWKVTGTKRFSGWRQFELTQDKIADRKRENCGFGYYMAVEGKSSNTEMVVLRRIVNCK